MKLLISGDFAPRLRIAEMLSKNDYSFFEEVKKYTASVDYSILNLEAPIVIRDSKSILKTGPSLRGPKESVYAIKYAGFDCVTLANNHFRDYGQRGVEDTIETLKTNGIDYVGAGKDLFDARQTLFKRINNTEIAILNFCENEWSIAQTNYGGSNPLKPISNYYDILNAKNNAEHVLVIIHGGIEHYRLPTPRMKELYRFFIDCGADAVINHHQHCFSGYEIYNGKPIFYGLGNFCFDAKHLTKNWCTGYMLELNLEEDVVEFQLIPYEQCTPNKIPISILQDRQWFDKEIRDLNEIICDDDKLKQGFDSLCAEGPRRFASLLIPYRNKYLKALALRGYIPKLISKNKCKRLRAYISCESHYECLLNYLNKVILK